jgi:hypothetical protein
MPGCSGCIAPATPRGILVIENGVAGLGSVTGDRERMRGETVEPWVVGSPGLRGTDGGRRGSTRSLLGDLVFWSFGLLVAACCVR